MTRELARRKPELGPCALLCTQRCRRPRLSLSSQMGFLRPLDKPELRQRDPG